MTKDTEATRLIGEPPRVAAVRRPESSGRGPAVGLSLSFKILFAVLALVIVIISSMVTLMQWKATRVTRRAIDAGMKNTGRTFSAFLAVRFNQVRTNLRQLADDPVTVSAITTFDHKTVLDHLSSKRQEVMNGAAYLMALDGHGDLLAKTDAPEKTGDHMADRSPLFSMPLTDGQEAWGFSERNGRLNLVAAAPLREHSTNIVGVVVVAYPLDAAFAADAKTVVNADATFFTQGEKELAMAASTLTPESVDSMRSMLGVNPQIGRASMNEGKTVGPVEIDLAGDLNVVIAVPLLSAGSDTVGLFVASRSLYQEMASYRQIRDTLLYLGIGAILLAFLISFVMARRITRPITALVGVTEQVCEGNLDVEVPPAPNDEVGLLSRSFAKMLVELRQKVEMEEYLQNLKMQGATQPRETQTVATALKRDATVQASAGDPAARTESGMPVVAESCVKIGGIFNSRYEIIQALGSGAMGTVYRAKDRDLDEEVAIKTIKAEALKSDPSAIERFKQEIKLARRITDKHVLRTFDFGEVNGTFFITMEYVRAVTLTYILEQRKSLPLGPGLHLAKQICLGLAAAHEQEIVHRDIKPQNMLVNARGDLKLMDFGIARLQGSGGMTQTGVVIGTPDYMSPEQATGRPLDARTDIYSTGVVLYQMFCGTLPFGADTALAMVLKHIQEAPRPPRAANPKLPRDLEKIILRSLAKEPGDRYQKISEVYDALSALSATR